MPFAAVLMTVEAIEASGPNSAVAIEITTLAMSTSSFASVWVDDVLSPLRNHWYGAGAVPTLPMSAVEPEPVDDMLASTASSSAAVQYWIWGFS